MSAIAHLSRDSRSGKWVATYSGRVLASSTSRNYVVDMIRLGRCNRAKQHGVVDVVEVGQQAQSATAPAQDKFSINERFEFLSDFVNMSIRREVASVIVTGEGGLGKTYTVMKALAQAGLKDSADMTGCETDSIISHAESKKLFTIVKGYSTAKGLYRTLYENRNRLLVFDDCDSVLTDNVALNLLKGALDSYDKRIICWNSESFSADDDLPRSFQFRGSVIFISNRHLFKIDQAVRSRAICVDVSMNSAQKIERMEAIISTPEFLPDYDISHKKAALSLLGELKDHARELSLRTLISVTKIAGTGDENWKRRAEYLLTAV